MGQKKETENYRDIMSGMTRSRSSKLRTLVVRVGSRSDAGRSGSCPAASVLLCLTRIIPRYKTNADIVMIMKIYAIYSK